jgi:hypothetical protein
MNAFKPLLELELQRVAAPSAASPGARVYMLLPSLEELVGRIGFGRNNPICLPNTRRPFDPLTFYGSQRPLAETIH